MSDHSITTLPRQTGLLEATQIIANNIANSSTPGFKGEGTIFSEYVAAAGQNNPSTSIGQLVAVTTDYSSGALELTNGSLDLAIDGPGFFKVNTDDGARLTRAGSFQVDSEGLLIDPLGNSVLDEGGSAIEIPPDAVTISFARDGTLSIDGEIFGNIGVFEPTGEMLRAGNNYWNPVNGDRPAEEPGVVQGYIEQSNVSPVSEFAKLITAQRLFEAGQALAEQEQDRLNSLINSIRQQG